MDKYIEKLARTHNSVYVAIAGEEVNRRPVLIRNFVQNGQVRASNPLLHIHANVACHIKDNTVWIPIKSDFFIYHPAR